MHVCLSGLTLGHESRRLLTNRIVKPHMRNDFIFPWRILDPSYRHFTFKSVCHLPFTATFAYMCEWERLSVRLWPTCMVYAYENGCTDFNSFSVCFMLLAQTFLQPLLESLWFSEPLFLPWTQDISIQTYSVIHYFLFGFNSLTTLDFFSNSFELVGHFLFIITNLEVFQPRAYIIAHQLKQEMSYTTGTNSNHNVV